MENKNQNKNQNEFNPSFFYNLERGVTKAPKFLEYWKNNQEWINCGDKDNCYPQELLRLYLDPSALHTTLIRKKSKMAAGNGFYEEGLNGTALNFLKNRFGEDSMDVIAYKCAIDLFIFGGFYLNTTWSKDGTKIARVQHVPYEKVRVGKPCAPFTDLEGNEHEIKKFFISRDWENWRRGENTPKEIIAFNPLLSKEKPEQLIFTKQYSPGAEYYSYSDYTSALNWIKMAFEISVFHLKSIQNNMNSGMIILNKSGINPSAEQRELDYMAIKQRFSGADNAGDILMVYAESGDRAPEFIPMPNNGSDQRFKDIMEQVNENIRLAHDASSIVANIETSGKLGNRTEIEEAFDMFQNTVIGPAQKMIEDTINSIASYNGIYEKLKLKNFKLFSTPTAVETEQAKQEEVKSKENLESEVPSTNDALRGLTAQENADMYRLIRDFTKGKINEHLAVTRIMAYGINEEMARKILGIEE